MKRAQQSVIAEFEEYCRKRTGLPLLDHRELWLWSIDHVEDFWAALWDFYDVRSPTPYTAVLDERRMPGARWFSGASVNYAEHVLRYDGGATPALWAVAEDGAPRTISWDELRAQVAALAAWLRAAGVQPGDHVGAYLPNTEHAVVGLLATAAVGAVWACCSPDFGADGAISRLAQVEPVVLILADGYRWNGGSLDRRAVGDELRAAVPSARRTVVVPYAFPDDPLPAGVESWADAVGTPAELTFEAVDFSHPLWVLFSSGTTGAPKGIVHGHGGIVLEHLKWGMYRDLRPGDRSFIYTSTGWMMWNAQVGSLLCGAGVVLFDGNPNHPSPATPWAVATETRATAMGLGAALVEAARKAGVRPQEVGDLSTLRTLLVTGSPLTAEGFAYAAEVLPEHVRLDSASGGTDVCSAFVGGCELIPVRPGETSTPYLGAAVASWDEEGRPRIGEAGELVLTLPMPSMPLYLLNDPDGVRLEESYFQPWPGVWRHGDWVTVEPHGGVVIHGRSDSTLNRQGVRLGSGEIYDVVTAMPEVRDCLVVGVEQPGGYYLPLFVVPADGVAADDATAALIKATIRKKLTPHHVPDEVVFVPGIPRTLTGKRMEVPVKRLLQGRSLDSVANLDAVADADVLRWFADFATRRLS